MTRPARIALTLIFVPLIAFYGDAVRRVVTPWMASASKKSTYEAHYDPAPVVIDRFGNVLKNEKPRLADDAPAHRFSDGPALRMIEWDEFQFVDERGAPLFSRTFKNARPFSEGLAAVSDISQTGMKEDRQSTLSFGSSPWRYIDKSGKVAFNRQFARVSEFHAGRAIVTTPDRPWNPVCIDATGKTVFDNPTYTDIYPFSDDGYAIVSTGFPPMPFGLIDKDGKLVVKDVRIENFSEGLGAFRDRATGRYGYVDAKGTIVIKPRFFMAYPFSEGLAVVSDKDTAPTIYEYSTCSRLTYSHIDKSGNPLPIKIDAGREISGATKFRDGTATLFFYENQSN